LVQITYCSPKPQNPTDLILLLMSDYEDNVPQIEQI